MRNAFLWRNPPEAESRKQIEAEIYYRCEQFHLLEKPLNLKARKGTFIDVSIDDISSNNEVNTLAEKLRDYLALGSRPAF